MQERAIAPLGQRVFAPRIQVPRIEKPPPPRITERVLDRRQNLLHGGTRFGAGESERPELALDARALHARAFPRPPLESTFGHPPQQPMSDHADLSRRLANPVELDDLALRAYGRLRSGGHALRRRR